MNALHSLPLFPLGLVLHPTEQLPLHIFEPRYMEMMQYCLEEGKPFGVVLVQEGQLASVGCTARIEQVIKTYEDGRLDVIVTGENRFRLGSVNEDRSFLQVEARPLVSGEQPPALELVERLITQHMKLLELAGRSPAPAMYQDRPQLSFFIGHNAGLSLEQRQELLELPGEAERVAFLVDHLQKFIPRVQEAESFRRKISSNGHFPDFPVDLDEEDPE